MSRTVRTVPAQPKDPRDRQRRAAELYTAAELAWFKHAVGARQ